MTTGAIDRVTARLSDRHRRLAEYMRKRGDWTLAREVAADDVVYPSTVNTLLRDLERLGVLEVRLVGGGFCEWRHRPSKTNARRANREEGT